MAQNRPPPAYQEYAASMLANNDFRMMSLPARGLWYTLRLEYWLENPLPSDPVRLAKILRLDQTLVASALDELGELVTVNNGMINIPELEDYRSHLSDIRRKQSTGGKEGAQIAKRNAANRKKTMQVDTDPEVNPEVTNASALRSSVQHRSVKSNTDQSIPVTNDSDQWVVDYDKSDVHGYQNIEAQKLNKFNHRQ